MTIEELAKSEGIWVYDENNDSDLALKSCVRFHRNIKGYPFGHKLNGEQRKVVSDLLIHSIHDCECCADCSFYNFNDIARIDKKIFLERNIVGDDNFNDSVIILSHEQNLYFVLNGENHLQLFTSGSGFQFDPLYVLGKRILSEISNKLEFAYSPKFGFLTADPQKAGAGLELSIVLHLSGLSFTDRINELIVDIDKRGLGLKGSWIDGYYRIYNKRSIGFSEKSLYHHTLAGFEEIIQRERSVREQAYKSSKTIINDKVWRSYGILLSSHLMSLFEAFDLLSNLRLGISLGVIDYIRIKDINLLLHFIQDYHLRKRYNIHDDQVNLDEIRASFIRDYLKEVI